MTTRYICIHGHFYQPPRENPWLEAIEIQDSAHPYHDWNQRVTAQCYSPNATARILDDKGCIIRITNNYARMSFNVGPTLLAWMRQHAPEVYDAILDADRQSRKRFGGHGSAMAQAYNHMILPLANTADRRTQIVWGIRDFSHRFGRSPEGMWLPETAVDIETLTLMARQGILFTILSPSQAERVRPDEASEWQDVSDGTIDPRRAYLQRLPENLSMAIFFYHSPISRDIAFGGLLNNGEALAARLMNAFDAQRQENQLVHVATDGETYGHHHYLGDMALAYALEKIDTDASVRLTNYGAFLAEQPPIWEVEIKENTAWSCPHGVARWQKDCGCNTGQHQNWRQAWRAPLRDALDWLRDALAKVYDQQAGQLLIDPWKARNDYIDVILDHDPATIDRFLARHAAVRMDNTTRIRALKLLEMQRQTMLMYTSCGWFFDELSGIETVQVIQYAGRAVQLAEALVDAPIEHPFVEKLALAQSNIRKHKDGRTIYEKWVRPSSVDLKKTAAHYAISALFEDYPTTVSIFCYSIERLDGCSAEAGNSKISVGRVRVTSRMTRESDQFHYVVFTMGDHNLSCGIKRFEETDYFRISEDLLDIFDRGNLPGVFHALGNYFPQGLYSLTSLFRDEQRKVLTTILESAITGTLAIYRQLYNNHIALMRFISDSSSRIPKALYIAAETVINHDLNGEFLREALDDDTIREMIAGADRAGIALDEATLEFSFRHHLEELAQKVHAHPEDVDLLRLLAKDVELAEKMPFSVSLQIVQNYFYRLGKEIYPQYQTKADEGDTEARQWTMIFNHLASLLSIQMR